MSTTMALFTRWMVEKGHPSERQAAIALGVHPTNVTLWKAGKNAGADVLERMALDLGENPAACAALAMAEQTKGDASRAWSRIARRFGAAATVAAVALVVPYAAHASAGAIPVVTGRDQAMHLMY